jgi:site-specific DNA-methyltransferase (adenine-specific)
MTTTDSNPGTVPFDTIIKGDCLRILPTLPAHSVDFVLTDPPYIARYKSRDGRTVPNDDNASWLKTGFRRDIPGSPS